MQKTLLEDLLVAIAMLKSRACFDWSVYLLCNSPLEGTKQALLHNRSTEDKLNRSPISWAVLAKTNIPRACYLQYNRHGNCKRHLPGLWFRSCRGPFGRGSSQSRRSRRRWSFTSKLVRPLLRWPCHATHVRQPLAAQGCKFYSTLLSFSLGRSSSQPLQSRQPAPAAVGSVARSPDVGASHAQGVRPRRIRYV